MPEKSIIFNGVCMNLYRQVFNVTKAHWVILMPLINYMYPLEELMDNVTLKG